MKETAENISYPITILFNKSLGEGILPSDWNLANVTCIYKSGDKTQSSISMTSTCTVLQLGFEGRGMPDRALLAGHMRMRAPCVIDVLNIKTCFKI